jgi:hypothetical protein
MLIYTLSIDAGGVRQQPFDRTRHPALIILGKCHGGAGHRRCRNGSHPYIRGTFIMRKMKLIFPAEKKLRLSTLFWV